jgi:hypothetical protein
MALMRFRRLIFEEHNLAKLPDHKSKLLKLRRLIQNRMKGGGEDETLSGPPRHI